MSEHFGRLTSGASSYSYPQITAITQIWKVMIDEDLAELYGVPTKRLNEQVRRNSKRFPADFMFQLTKVEAEALRSQVATSKVGRGGRRSLPYAFTELCSVRLDKLKPYEIDSTN